MSVEQRPGLGPRRRLTAAQPVRPSVLGYTIRVPERRYVPWDVLVRHLGGRRLVGLDVRELYGGVEDYTLATMDDDTVVFL